MALMPQCLGTADHLLGGARMKHIKAATKKLPTVAADGCCDCICGGKSQKLCYLKGAGCPNPKDDQVQCFC